MVLRNERQGADWRNLWAYVDGRGDLHIDGQDLGPDTALVSSDGEYEWFGTIRAVDVPLLTELLGGEPSEDILDLLQARWTGASAAELERIIRDSGIPVARHFC